ncbi:hypothetical protein [Pectobacterium polaris]|uniref:hypothetical protein n=1 Tax=Pectobacterium polaris TaxID=2042057 RepID=UPI0015E80F72|nr:hypothetical protein [Pectobacterium polaris]
MLTDADVEADLLVESDADVLADFDADTDIAVLALTSASEPSRSSPRLSRKANVFFIAIKTKYGINNARSNCKC